jgi:methylglutaconyl-CoA hydratase
MTSRLSITDQDRVRRIALNRPEVHNAFDDALIAELTAAIDDAGRDESVRAVVLTGEGEFSMAD